MEEHEPTERGHDEHEGQQQMDTADEAGDEEVEYERLTHEVTDDDELLLYEHEELDEQFEITDRLAEIVHDDEEREVMQTPEVMVEGQHTAQLVQRHEIVRDHEEELDDL